MKILNDSAWFGMEKLKKHSFETKKQKEQKLKTPKNQKIYVRSYSMEAFFGLFARLLTTTNDY